MVLCIILHTCVLDDTQEHHLSVLKLLHVSYVLYVFCIGCFRTLLTCSTNKTLHVLNLNTGVLLHSLNTSNMFWKCYILVFYLVFYSGTLIFRPEIASDGELSSALSSCIGRLHLIRSRPTRQTLT